MIAVGHFWRAPRIALYRASAQVLVRAVVSREPVLSLAPNRTRCLCCRATTRVPTAPRALHASVFLIAALSPSRRTFYDLTVCSQPVRAGGAFLTSRTGSFLESGEAEPRRAWAVWAPRARLERARGALQSCRRTRAPKRTSSPC
jgi:hypothetical protein